MSVAEPARARPTVSWLQSLAAVSAGLFLLSAGVATLVAYDLVHATFRLTSLLIGLLTCGRLAFAGQVSGWRVLAGFGYLATMVSLSFGIWARFVAPDDVAVAAGVLVILLPFQVVAVVLAHLQGRRLLVELMSGATVLCGWLLVLTGERSAWIAVVVGAVTAMLYGHVPNPAYPRFWWWARIAWAGVLALMATGYIALVVASPVLKAVAPFLDPDVVAHVTLWRQMLGLVGDYRFTGSGLGMTAMVASSYLFLLHVPLFHHAHNTLIQVALEQGAPGVVAMAGLVVATSGMAHDVAQQRDYTLHWVGVGALAAIVTAVVHGLFDSELYASVWAPICFLPLGYGWGAYAYARHITPDVAGPARTRGWLAWRAGLVMITAALGLGLWVLLGETAALYANLGALAQTRTELRVYHWPEWGVQDQVRRLATVNLEPARGWLRQALAEDPRNGTALRRLGQIALSRGEYSLACDYLLAASEAHPPDRAVRQLLGECYALDGASSDAAQMWHTIDLTHNQLGLRLAWYAALGDSQRTQRMREAIELYERGIAPQ